LKAWFRKSMTAIARVAGEIATADTNAHKLAQAVNYIDTHYHKDISRDDVAAHVHLTPCYFSQFFKQHMGDSFVEHLRRIRIERAKYLLEYTSENTADISMKIGYNDSKYFYRVFKEHTGYTPCEYKRMVTTIQCAL
jgi:two-component system response regulator YesN